MATVDTENVTDTSWTTDYAAWFDPTGTLTVTAALPSGNDSITFDGVTVIIQDEQGYGNHNGVISFQASATMRDSTTCEAQATVLAPQGFFAGNAISNALKINDLDLQSIETQLYGYAGHWVYSPLTKYVLDLNTAGAPLNSASIVVPEPTAISFFSILMLFTFNGSRSIRRR